MSRLHFNYLTNSLLIAGIGLLFSGFLVLLSDLKVISLFTGPGSKSITLFIAIISARENFEKREVARRTWLKNLDNFTKVKYKFFIGNGCNVPLEDRHDELSCFKADIKTDKGFYSNHILGHFSCSNKSSSLLNVPNLNENAYCYNGFGFQAVHPLILHSIGVHISSLTTLQDIEIEFRDAEEVFEKINFSKDGCSSHQQNGFCFINLSQKYFLPKGFEGAISIVAKDAVTPSSETCRWVSEGLFRFTFGRIINHFEKYEEGKCSFVIANFTLEDDDSVQTFIHNSSERQTNWVQLQGEINSKLIVEANENQDLIFLPTFIDVYRHLPMKVLNSFKWVYQNYPGTFVLKADDDIAVNVPLLMQQDLFHKPYNNSLDIWSHFYYHRSVPLFGKWADFEFESVMYPPFPSGYGYLLSGHLITLFVDQLPFLRKFQGEDISVGIWTQVLEYKGNSVKKNHVPCWLPSETCRESVLS